MSRIIGLYDLKPTSFALECDACDFLFEGASDDVKCPRCSNTAILRRTTTDETERATIAAAFAEYAAHPFLSALQLIVIVLIFVFIVFGLPTLDDVFRYWGF